MYIFSTALDDSCALDLTIFLSSIIFHIPNLSTRKFSFLILVNRILFFEQFPAKFIKEIELTSFEIITKLLLLKIVFIAVSCKIYKE